MTRTTHRRFAGLLAVLTLVALLAPPAPATAASDPYAADPLRLVPFADTVQQVYTSGTDTWEVWECHVPGWSDTFDVTAVVNALNATVADYFDWLSDGRYRPAFTVGGEVVSADVIPQDISNREDFRVPECETAVAAATTRTANGVLIVVAGGFNEGYGTAGAVCPEDPFTGCATTYPDNSRIAVVGAAAVALVPPFSEPQYVTVAHEIGHGLNWAHSYGGLNTLPSGKVDQYDNPMDVMSGETIVGDPVGTIAYNRYAAGWIDPSEVIIHRSGTDTFTLTANGSVGTHLLVIPIEDGHFYTLDSRRLTGFDASLPKAGVEVYEVDQRRATCSMDTAFPPATYPTTTGWPCFATLIRTTQTPPLPTASGTAHVLSIDEWLDLGSIRVTVLSADATSFTIRVEDSRTGTRFVDDDGNPHEANIEAIAAAGITNGCNPPLNDRYCPSRPVTRAEMAAFLIRALGEESSLPPYQGTFSDVPEGLWYTGYVEHLHELGISTGYSDGTYRPDKAVSRAEMAAFLTRALLLSPASTDYFTDDNGSFFEPDINSVAAAGITLGCNADGTLYCPNDEVLRDQMASFLARALGIAS